MSGEQYQLSLALILGETTACVFQIYLSMVGNGMDGGCLALDRQYKYCMCT